MGKDWTADEDQYLRDNYGKLSAAECANELTNRNRGMVIGRASRLGLCSNMIGGGWSPGKPRPRGTPSTKVRKPYVSNGRPTLKPTLQDKLTRVKPYEEPMPVPEGDQKLHSRQYSDLDSGMCHWPLYFEQGVQMYCAAATERLPGRFATYCLCHDNMSVDTSRRYRGRIWSVTK